MKVCAAFYLILLCLIQVNCNDNKPSHVSSGTIKAGGFQLYFERQGKGDPLILLHAGLQDHTMWEEQVKFFSKEYDVITPDLPFHGKTTGFDTVLLARDAIKILCDSLHLEKVSIAGLSMGASIVQDFIIAYPERVNKAVLISAGIYGYENKFPIDSVSLAWYTSFSKALESKDTAKAAVEFTQAWAEGIYRKGDSLKKPVSQYVYKTTLFNLKRHQVKAWPNLQDDPTAMEGLVSIRIPVLIIEGDKDLPIISKTSLYLEKTIPGAKRYVIKDVAHMLNMEKPDELNRVMEDFLKEQ